MSISFACPECRVRIEVADEHAGETGQCPRCQSMVEVPSPNKPTPTLVGAKEVPLAKLVDEEPPAKRRSVREAEETEHPSRGQPSTPKPPAGPMWPWVVGILAALVAAGLLFGSLLVLAFWRKAEPKQPPSREGPGLPVFQIEGGRLEGRRILLQDALVRLRAEVDRNDPGDLELAGHCKVYEIQMQGNRNYTFELDTNAFDHQIRIESIGNVVLARQNGFRHGKTRLDYWPEFGGAHLIYVASRNQDVGRFTLTIRDDNFAKKGF